MESYCKIIIWELSLLQNGNQRGEHEVIAHSTIIYSIDFFILVLADSFFTGVWVTTNLLRSSRLLGFGTILIVL